MDLSRKELITNTRFELPFRVRADAPPAKQLADARGWSETRALRRGGTLAPPSRDGRRWDGFKLSDSGLELITWLCTPKPIKGHECDVSGVLGSLLVTG